MVVKETERDRLKEGRINVKVEERETWIEGKSGCKGQKRQNDEGKERKKSILRQENVHQRIKLLQYHRFSLLTGRAISAVWKRFKPHGCWKVKSQSFVLNLQYMSLKHQRAVGLVCSCCPVQHNFSCFYMQMERPSFCTLNTPTAVLVNICLCCPTFLYQVGGWQSM